MDRLDLFSLISDVLPRVTAVVVVVGLLVCPNVVSSALVSAARERGQEIAVEFDRILLPHHATSGEREHGRRHDVPRRLALVPH
jgi:hypothetical protein